MPLLNGWPCSDSYTRVGKVRQCICRRPAQCRASGNQAEKRKHAGVDRRHRLIVCGDFVVAPLRLYCGAFEWSRDKGGKISSPKDLGKKKATIGREALVLNVLMACLDRALAGNEAFVVVISCLSQPKWIPMSQPPRCPICEMTIPWTFMRAGQAFRCPSCSELVRVKQSSHRRAGVIAFIIAVAAAYGAGATGLSLAIISVLLSLPFTVVAGMLLPKILGLPMEAVPHGGHTDLGESIDG